MQYLVFLLLGLLAFSAKTQQWTVSWKKNSESDMWRYNLYRDTASLPTTFLTSVMHPDTVFIDTQIEKGVLYYYRVTAVDSAGNESGFSEEAFASLPKITGLPASLTLPADTTYTISLNNFVVDPDQSVQKLSWEVGSVTHLSVQINPQTNVLTIQTPAGWSAQENVELTVTDSLGFTDTAIIQVNSSASSTLGPTITPIPDQTIQEGSSFTTIALDDYVNDPDNSDPEITWTAKGADELQIQISADRLVTVVIPDSNWFGSETIVFRATDPTQFFAEDTVVFTVINVNDPPVFQSIADQFFSEGMDKIELNLADYVTDIDNSKTELTWSASGQNQLLVSISPSGLATVSLPAGNWVGEEAITFRVTDPGDLFAETTATFIRQSGSIGNITSLSTAFYGSGTNVRLRWETPIPTRDHIEYGLSSSYTDSTETEPDFSTFHEQIIDGLQPSTTYHFRIVSLDENGVVTYSPDSTFTTGQVGDINVFPIPFVASSSTQNRHIIFTNLPRGGRILIYNLLGEPVFNTANATSIYHWNVKNNAGKDVQAGLYLYVIKNEKNEKVKSGKLIIVR
ncbi:MAG: hypothetical protein Kow0042_15430 [Calditrichia bacterium]